MSTEDLSLDAIKIFGGGVLGAGALTVVMQFAENKDMIANGLLTCLVFSGLGALAALTGALSSLSKIGRNSSSKNDPNNQRFVTHYYSRPTDGDNWLPTNYLTQKPGQADYYFESTDVVFLPEKMDADIQNGSLVQLPLAQRIEEDQTIYIAPSRSAFIANAKKPHDNPRNKIFLDNANFADGADNAMSGNAPSALQPA